MVMMQRKLALGSAVVLVNVALGVGVFALDGCGGGSPSRPSTGGAGTSSPAGQAGATASGGAGSGTGGEVTSGGAGTGSGSAGAPDQSGTAGASSGQAGGGAAGATGVPGAMGTGGATATAGATGTGGTTGAGGTSGAAGATGGRPSGPSAGCTAEVPNEPIGKSVQHNMMVMVAPAYQPQYVMRKYYTTIPMGYNPDPANPYPVVFWGPGCGATGPEGSSVTGASYINKILYVQMLSVTGCFQAGKQGTADSPDGPYFDQMLAEVEQRYCIDKGKVFAAGTSSGAWMANFLACERGNVIRGTAADSGGLQHDHGTCTGGAAVMEMPGDTTSAIVNGFDIGAGPARDLFIMINGCSTMPMATSFAKATNCQIYGNCASPVVWCNTGGAHQAGNGFIAESAWQFWNTLK
jgi:hypothetical protein